MLGKHLVSVAQLSSTELETLLQRALQLKVQARTSSLPPILRGRVLALLFQKPSLRTRVSFEVAMRQLGGDALYLGPDEVGMGERESVADVARMLSRLVSGIVARTYRHQDVVGLAEHADVPVINGLTDREHPCQTLADLLTLLERFHALRGLRVAYIGDGNNVAHSLILAAARLGMEIVVATPRGYEPDAEIVRQARSFAEESGARVELTEDPAAAARDAQAIYTDTWYSMGFEREREIRLLAFRPYQINVQLLQCARPDTVVLHCLPAHRGEEITAEVLDGPHSVVLDQAENRLHAQRALLALLLGDHGAEGGTDAHLARSPAHPDAREVPLSHAESMPPRNAGAAR